MNSIAHSTRDDEPHRSHRRPVWHQCAGCGCTRPRRDGTCPQCGYPFSLPFLAHLPRTGYLEFAP